MQQMFLQVFSDLKVLYSNFIHWNISKILIGIISLVLWILMALPFFAVWFLLAYLSPIDWKTIFSSLYLWNSFDFLLLSVLSQNIFYVIFIILIVILWVWIFFLWTSYKYVLISKLYLNYIDWEKMPYFKGNIYFSWKYIIKYTSLLWVSALYLLIPFFLFIIFAWILILIFGWFDWVWAIMKNPINLFSSLLLLFFIASLIFFFYITYRLQFAYFYFLDDKQDFLQKASFYIKKSFSATKNIKLLWKYLVLIIVMWLILSPFFFIESRIASNLADYKLLYSYKTDEVFVKNLDEDSKYEATLLEKKYEYLDNDDLKYELTKYWAYSNIWGILFFLFLWNIENMVFISFYRRILLAEKIQTSEKESDEE